MRRYRQTLDEILEHLSPVDTSWRDDHADAVIARLRSIPRKTHYTRADLVRLLDANTKAQLEAGLTVVRLFVDMSKDEFTAAVKDQLGSGIGINRMKEDSEAIYSALEALGVLERMTSTINHPVTWHDVLTERLKGKRGSAIKGQRRGRYLEDFVEVILCEIFGNGSYDPRCRFIGAKGVSDEKADFAIPSKDYPAILIEAKAYGATGSKQTDVLGDISRICQEKRPDTHFLLVTDGITWRERTSDLEKLVDLQNQGQITRIYTQSMVDQLTLDLRQLKDEHGL